MNKDKPTYADLKQRLEQAETDLAAAQQRQSEMREEARVQQNRLKMAQEAAGMISWEWDVTTGSVQYFQDLSVIVRGEKIEPYCSVNTLLQEIHPEDRERLAKVLDETAKSGHPWECEYRVHILDGTYRWILGRGKTAVVEDGKPVRMLGVSTDITLSR